ncbi:hypothetical protein CLOP_g9419 [Closterium sp. NIES-67]|nr:hypothetical protein CLOP_g9419 [Closterium sp. NIES-67]
MIQIGNGRGRGRGGWRGRGRGRSFGRGRGRGDYNEGHGSSSGRGSTRMEGTCWYCKKVGHPWFKCFSRPEGWSPPGMKPPSGERAQGGAVQGSGAQGCTSHMTPRADLLDEVKPPGKIKYVAAASGALLPVIGVGNAKVKGANGELVGLGNVLLVEGLSANLLSVRRLQKSKAEVTFGPTSCRAKLGKKEWKQQQQKLPSTPLIVEADEVQQPSRQVEVAVSEEEMSGVTEEGGAAEVEQQQQQHESPPRVPHPPERPRRDVRPPVRLTYGGRGKPNVVQAGRTTLRVLLAIAALLGWKIRQMDIVTAFLNGIILEEVYMKQPEGLDDGSGREVVGESDRKLFHSMVGSLNYAANHTRPDIAFATSRLANS